MTVEITATKTGKPKLTVAKGRVALKFHQDLPDEERAPYIRYAELIAAKIGEPEFTLRGKFMETSILLRGGKKSYYFKLAELC